MTAAAGFRKEHLGWVFGLSAVQLAVCTAAWVPVVGAMSAQQYRFALGWLPVAVLIVLLATVPIKGRVAVTWLTHWVRHTTGTAAGWSAWQSKAAAGLPVTPTDPDLPGILTRFRLLDGPVLGEHGRVCLTHDTVDDRWGATARLTFSGVGLISAAECAALGEAMGNLAVGLNASRRVNRFSLYLRTVPDDGTRYTAYRQQNRVADVPELVATSAEQMSRMTGAASVLTEAFLHVSATESTLAARAKDGGGGVTGRGYALYPSLTGLTEPLAAMGVDAPQWLTGEGVAEALRTGFCPADAGAVARRHLTDQGGLPMAVAGPNRATNTERVYYHDGYATVSYTVMMSGLSLPFGALAPLMTVRTAGERRCVAVHYEVIDAHKARTIAKRERQHTTGMRTFKHTKGFGVAAEDTKAMKSAERQEDAVASGHALLRAAVVVSTTVPADWKVEEHADALHNDIVARFVPLRQDLVQDSAFVAACIPVGVGLHNIRGEF